MLAASPTSALLIAARRSGRATPGPFASRTQTPARLAPRRIDGKREPRPAQQPAHDAIVVNARQLVRGQVAQVHRQPVCPRHFVDAHGSAQPRAQTRDHRTARKSGRSDPAARAGAFTDAAEVADVGLPGWLLFSRLPDSLPRQPRRWSRQARAPVRSSSPRPGIGTIAVRSERNRGRTRRGGLHVRLPANGRVSQSRRGSPRFPKASPAGGRASAPSGVITFKHIYE